MKNFITIVAVATVVGVACFYMGTHYRKPQPAQPQPSPLVTLEPNTPPPADGVIKDVIDPITVRLESGHVIRYIGVKTPSVTAPVECFAKEAMLANEAMIGQKVRLEEEPLLPRSADGAWTRYVFFTPTEEKDKKPTEILINERMMEGGFGFPIVNDKMKYGERILSAAKYASATKQGLWGKCEVKKDDKTEQLSTAVTTQCTIKGKIIDEQHKVYRLDTCRAYGQTILKKTAGDAWFCSEDEAQKAGFQKASDCQ